MNRVESAERAAPRAVQVGVYCPHTPTLFEEGLHPVTERALRGLAPLLAGVDALVVASPHWLGRGGFLVQAAARPRCIQDYYGFPPAYYSFRYDAVGDPDLARAIAAEARATGLVAETTEAWGLDHGHWVPLLFLRPDAGLPVVALSISTGGPEEHRGFGEAVARAAASLGRRVALVATGSPNHRLDGLTWGENRPDPAGEAFDRTLIERLLAGRPDDVAGIERRLWEAAEPEGGLRPLFILLGALRSGGGAAGGGLSAELLGYERMFTSISLLTMTFRASS